MLACRTLLYESVRSSMSSWAFSVAFFIATIRELSSLAFDSSTAWNRRGATQRGTRGRRQAGGREGGREGGGGWELKDDRGAGAPLGVLGRLHGQELLEDRLLDERGH